MEINAAAPYPVRAMKVLRLGNSNEFSGGVTEEERAAAVAERILAEGAGEQVETLRKKIWPTPKLPGLVDQWLDEFQPDLVFLKVNVFWFMHESVPLRIERKVPLVGKYIARAGWKAQDAPAVATSPPAQSVRRFVERVVGGDTYFTSKDVFARMETVIRRIVAREEVGLLVEFSQGSRPQPELTAAQVARKNRRRSEMHAAIKGLCEDLHVEYFGRDGPRPVEEARLPKAPDGVHHGAERNQQVGARQGEMLLKIWREMHAPADRPLVAR